MSSRTMPADAAPDQAELILHVLHGPNTGAELRLGSGVWLIGTGAAADLTFADPDLADEHLRLTVTGAEISVEALAESVRIDGRPLVVGESEPLALLHPLWIGRTAFAVGPSGSIWPDPVASPLSKPTAAAPAPATTPIAAPAREPAAMPRPRGRGYLWAGVAAGCLLLAIIAGAWVFDITTHASPQGKPVVATDPLQPVQAAIQALGLQNATTASLSSNGITVTGLVPTSRDQTTLAAALHRIDPAITLNVITETWLRDMVGTVLRGYAVDASVTIQPDGQVRLAGYAPTSSAADAAARRLRQDIPWISTLDYAIVTPDGAQADLEELLRRQGLTGLRATSAPHLVTVSGTLPPERLDAWNTIQAAFRQRYGDRILLATRLVPVSAAAPIGLSLGQNPYLIMDDGKRLGIGDMLGSLGRITMIFSDRLRVRTAQGDVDIRYTQPPNWILKDSNGPAR